MNTSIFDSITVPILILDQNKKIVRWNGAATRLTGLRKTQAVGRNIEDFLLTKTAGEQVRSLLNNIEQLAKGTQTYIPKSRVISWNDKRFKVDIEKFAEEGKLMLWITLVDFTWYEKEIDTLVERNRHLTTRIKASSSTENWVRKMILTSLFGSILFCLVLAVVVESFSNNISSQYIQTMITSFTGLLSVAIGFYFRTDGSSKKEKLDEDAKVINDTHLPEEKIINIE